MENTPWEDSTFWLRTLLAAASFEEVDRPVDSRNDASSNDNGDDRVLGNEVPSSLCLFSRFCLRHFARRFLNQT